MKKILGHNTKGPALEEFVLNGITTALIDPHNDAYYYWKDYKNSDLIHIDYHSDMCGSQIDFLENETDEEYYKKLRISNFICPAVHYGYIKNIYWFNPYKNRLIKYKELSTTIITYSSPEIKLIRWLNPEKVYDNEDEDNQDNIKDKIKLRNDKPFILDIDLDAFSCEDEDDGKTTDYLPRIEQSIKMIENLKKPDLITIATSQTPTRFVPEDKVEEVYFTLIYKLNKLTY